ncbi:MAG: dienelactone hydrolase family protein [Nannocystaceae bacterium]
MISQRTVSVATDDGAFDLHLWTPAAGHGPAILLLQEIFGVSAYIRAVAARLADAGYVVGAPDVFWRFARNWEAEHDEAGLQASFAQVQKLDPQLAVADCVAALRRLGELPEAEGRPGVLGFCLGGTLAWGVAAAGDPACCVSYYGSNVSQMLGLADQIQCPVLIHYGDNDPYIPMEGIVQVQEALRGRDGFTVNLERSGHAFDNHESAMFFDPEASRSAWAKTMAFLGQHLPLASAAS